MNPAILLQSIAENHPPQNAVENAERMAGHYRRMRLLHPDGTWVSPLLARLGTELLPQAVSTAEIHAFLRKMLDLQLLNPFFAAVLEQSMAQRFPQLEQAVRTEGRSVIPDAVALAMALDRLTRACRRDSRIWAECRHLLKRALHQTGAWRKASFFLRIKAASVDPVAYFCIRAHDRPPEALGLDSGSRWLQVNILQAVWVDFCSGYRANAAAGWILARHKPGRRTPDPATGAGPNGWSPDGQAICLHPPFPKEWADLYQIWNMAFVSQMPEFPYVAATLLIPEVAGYAAAPAAYMYSRVIALNLFLAWLLMDRAAQAETRPRHLPWNDPVLTHCWGACARASSRQYRALVRQARPAPP